MADQVNKPINKAELFSKEYQELCEKHGMRLVVSPIWVSTNHGSFEMVLQYTVGELPKQS
jgi:hypothetical protein